MNLDESRIQTSHHMHHGKKPAASLGAKLHDSDRSSWFAWERCVLIPMSNYSEYSLRGKGWQDHPKISRMLDWHEKLRGSVVKNASDQ